MEENRKFADESIDSSAEITEFDIWLETAELYFQLEAEKQELESIIESVRNIIESEESDDFKLSRIDTILFGWRNSGD